MSDEFVLTVEAHRRSYATMVLSSGETHVSLSYSNSMSVTPSREPESGGERRRRRWVGTGRAGATTRVGNLQLGEEARSMRTTHPCTRTHTPALMHAALTYSPHTHSHTHTPTHTLTLTHSHKNTYTHTLIHTHTHTQTQTHSPIERGLGDYRPATLHRTGGSLHGS